MLRLSIPEMIKRIEQGVPFEAVARDNSFTIRISKYVPYVCTAIHDGHAFRDELKLKSLLSEYERWYEEDPFTGEFISSMPIVLTGLDSRFEYDLNREPSTAVYDTAWGKKVWKKPLTKAEKQRSLKKHENYYKVTHALISKLEDLFDACVVYDMHSYNYKRWDRVVPVFNIGTSEIDNKRFGATAEAWREELAQIELPNGIENISAINDTFYGKGYNLAYITKNFQNTLVLATEVSKIYCDELTGEPYPLVVRTLQDQFKTAILNHAQSFIQEFTKWEYKQKERLLSPDLEKTILKIDRELFHLVKDFELLNYVNPINVAQEKKKFFDSKCTENPEFVYRPINVDAFDLKRRLHRLDVHNIQDVNIQGLYEGAINAYVDRVDMLSTLGSSRFMYNSLRYFGEPNETDIANAKFLIHLPEVSEEEKSPQRMLNVQDAVEMFKASFDDYGFQGKIEISKNMVASAMVLNQKKKVVLKKGATFSPKELRFLVHHEIGVHMVTTMNSNDQPLKIFNLGLPVNTLTQEGLAVLAEYLSGNITLKRLKELGLRVIAANMLVKGFDFKKTFRRLVNDYKVDVDDAFYVTTRIYRGGGFTKDFLYLRGFRDIYQFWKSGKDLGPLLIGKTSLEYYDTITEMIERGILNPPKYITKPFENPQTHLNNPIFDYIVSGIR